MIFVDICRVTAALVRGFGHHCTVFRSLRSGTPVTANLRKRNMRTGPEQPYSSSVGGDVGRHYVMGIVVKSQQCATQGLCGVAGDENGLVPTRTRVSNM